MKLLGSLLIHCVFTKKTEGAKKAQKFVKIGTGKNIGYPEQCVLYVFIPGKPTLDAKAEKQ